TELVAECARRGIPTVFTLNDYWLLCHRGQLLDRDYRRCGGPRSCGRCLDASAAANAGMFRGAAMIRALDARLPRVAGRWLGHLGRRGATLAARASGIDRATWERIEHMRAVMDKVTCFLAPSRTLRDRFVEFGLPGDRVLYRVQGIDRKPFQG